MNSCALQGIMRRELLPPAGQIPFTAGALYATLNTNTKQREWDMNIQIFGKSKCFDTKKAERYFKERRVKVQSIDVARYGMSPGEFRNGGGRPAKPAG